MNILKYSISFAILLRRVIASENSVSDVIMALEEEGFERIKRDWRKWGKRNDLFDYVVTKDLDFIVGFINQVEDAKRPTLAALFINRLDAVDEVLNMIEYGDNDFRDLTDHRPELVESYENFFKVIDKINSPENQEWVVDWGVRNLFNANKHILLFP